MHSFTSFSIILLLKERKKERKKEEKRKKERKKEIFYIYLNLNNGGTKRPK
jgi:hypothetical protein